MTASEAYRNAMRVIRDAAARTRSGRGRGRPGPCLLDGCRTTLIIPSGDDKQQSIKVTLMTAAHRWYLSRLGKPSRPVFLPFEPLGRTFQEARAWACSPRLRRHRKRRTVYRYARPPGLVDTVARCCRLPRTARPIDPNCSRVLGCFRSNGFQTWNVVGLFNWA